MVRANRISETRMGGHEDVQTHRQLPTYVSVYTQKESQAAFTSVSSKSARLNPRNRQKTAATKQSGDDDYDGFHGCEEESGQEMEEKEVVEDIEWICALNPFHSA